VPPSLDIARQVPDSTIYVARRGWHIDVGFAAADIQPPLAAVPAGFGEVSYVFFGFGDRHYLLARTHGGSVLLGALWPGPGMMLATALKDSPAEAFGASNVVPLRLSVSGMQSLQAFVWRSVVSHNSSVQPLGPGPYAGSAFFAATARYSALHTCNTWVAESLRSAMLPIGSGGVVFAGQLWRQVKLLQIAQSKSEREQFNSDQSKNDQSKDERASKNEQSNSEQSARIRSPASLYLQGGLEPSWQTTVVPEF